MLWRLYYHFPSLSENFMEGFYYLSFFWPVLLFKLMLWKPYLSRVKPELGCIKPWAWNLLTTQLNVFLLNLEVIPMFFTIIQGNYLEQNIISKRSVLCKTHFQRAFKDRSLDRGFPGLAKQAPRSLLNAVL